MKKVLAFIFFLSGMTIFGQVQTLDSFENKDGWSFIKSDGVNMDLQTDKGFDGNAVRFDYDFTKGTGYGGIQKLFPIDLPDNYEFTFYLKADSPANNLEIKFLDSTGNNVWWVIMRNYEFPTEWKKITVKKRHISFAWGPTEDKNIHRVDRIEFTISSFMGGKGTIWLDDLKFEPLPPETTDYPLPDISTTSALKGHQPEFMLDNLPETGWQSTSNREQHVMVDFYARREFGGLEIDWMKEHYAEAFDVMLSTNGKDWEKAYSVQANQSDRSFIRLPETEAKFVKLILTKGHLEKWFGIAELKFLDVKSSLTPNDFLIYCSEHSPKGDYPRYFNEQACYWTISGVNNDVKEALINEDGMVEVDKGQFSIEPVIRIGDSLYNWSNVKTSQSIGKNDPRNFSFVPEVEWTTDSLDLKIEIESVGEANVDSRLIISYSLNIRAKSFSKVDFYLLIRPFQVNPYYQWLNITGGAGKIKSISETSPGAISVDQKTVYSILPYQDFGAFSFDAGNPLELIRSGNFPQGTSATDPNSLAGGIMKYSFEMTAGKTREIDLIIPFYDKINPEKLDFKSTAADFVRASAFWKSKVDHIKFNLPPSADRIINTYKTNLVYILINRDKAGIQPGSRSYERSWIRDGALTSSALLKSGIVPEVKDFINWYSDNIYENGKIPCVVDFRGPDPVPENDSHGEYIYLVREYFNFTKDTAFLKTCNEHVLKAVDYMQTLIAQQTTDHFKFGNDSVRAQYGLMPESISHEGYSAKPMHSYWDDFFTMKGLKDAAEIQKILGETGNYNKIVKMRDTFRENLYHSLQIAMSYKGIDYIPGCAELGDFDATSTTIALTPCNELINLPKPQVYNTFDKYYEFFKNRRDGKADWVNYTPYENRLIGSFIILDQPERAHELIDFFLHDQRPQGWNHWAEVVWKDYRHPGYIGDMPHTWCGSDFLNAIRSMFVYENEYDQSLVIASALYQDWIDTPEGMSVEHLPTYYGEISYSIKKSENNYSFKIYSDLKPPPNGIKIRNFNGSKMPARVTVNGNEIKDFTEKEIPVKEFPADVVIYY
jgi:hypothetical protein